MRARRGYAVGTVLAVVLSLVLGWLVAGALSGALAIEFKDKELPPEEPTVVAATEVHPLAAPTEVVVPRSFAPDPRLELGRSLLDRAVQARESAPGSGPRIEVAVPDPALSGTGDEGYQIEASAVRVTVRAATALGLSNGLFRIADQIAAGRDWADLGTDGPVTPELADRFVDTGAVGVPPDLEAYAAQTAYQHASGALENVVLSEPPYVDPAGLAEAKADWKQFVDHAVAYGYNGVVVPGFLEYVNFDRYGDGFEIYPEDSPYRARHEVMKREVGAMWKYAHDMGLRVVFKSDMLALTTPLEQFLERETGMDPNDPELWKVYRAGLDELLGDFEWADGLMIRIGEGGSIYNHPGWDYYSALAVTDAADVRAMLETATDVAAEHDAKVYFRTWSVGVGDVGDMHTNPETYERLFADFHPENLVVSTKFTMGDFDSFLPLNPTLSVGEQNRLVEMQGRREFEAFSSIPDDVGGAHQGALQSFLADNDKIDGLWLWTQDGGPWRAGPMTLYLKDGFWQLYDQNVYTAGRLGWDPATDLGEANADWIARTYSDDPATIASVGRVLELSREAVLDGLYIRPYAEKQVFALGLEPPPMMWIFKWDFVSGDGAALAAVYKTVAEHPDGVDGAIADGERAIEVTRQMAAELHDVPASSFRDPALYDSLKESVDYELDLLTTLQTFRVLFLRYHEWLDTGSDEAYDAWQAALPTYRDAVAAHTARWDGNLGWPPYNFFASDIGMEHAERSVITRPAAIGLAVVALLALLLVPGLRAGAFTPWRIRRAVPTPGRLHRILVVAVPLLVVVASRVVFSSAMSVWYLVATLGSLALLAVAARGVLAWLRPGADAFWLWAGLGGVLLLRTLLFMAAVGVRGPGNYWFRFWVDEGIRETYVMVAFAAFVYSLIVLAVTLATSYDVRLRQGLGAVFLGIGAALSMLGGLLTGFGLERSLTTINDEMAVLPLGLSRILGLTVHLGIPLALPTWLLYAGAALGALGLLLAIGRRQREPV